MVVWWKVKLNLDRWKTDRLLRQKQRRARCKFVRWIDQDICILYAWSYIQEKRSAESEKKAFDCCMAASWANKHSQKSGERNNPVAHEKGEKEAKNCLVYG